ncbi:NAD-dependent epimerase/dehydratase family protein [Hymenobacter latericus]|uniref:NAD-dependent epimerase/dehydratase family protein n=1 Tax=Hymenobacter sp. YIM 151858-1 TaxID=2987688 RepID=UPI0022260BAA|nr:NAD-dependent epimerase/dehydratase family protein [Hymenobacter sp. YIM 151858-1]UYZ57452.1 NAD-dependent epimerase/dehydratase family protein [Hymenobacter sp. YIM 151858-1]
MLLPTDLTRTTCVIGGAGFIGRAVVTELLTLGRQVVVVGRNARPADLSEEVYYVANPGGASTPLIRQVLECVSEVIDLAYATSPQTSFQDPVNDILVNLPEAVQIFGLAASMTHIRKFVWISSGGTVYGRTAVPSISEQHSTMPISPYGITKLAIEKYARMYFETKQLPIVCVRPANAYGEWQRPYVGQGFVATAIASILDGRELTLFGEHGTIRDYVHVSDVASGIVGALLKGAPGEVYNLGSGIGLTNREVIEWLTPLANDAGFELNLRVQPPRAFDVPANVLDWQKLHLDTGWQPQVSFAEGIARTWEWFVARHATAISY